MGTSARPHYTSKHKKQKGLQSNFDSEDRISQLPHDIIVLILSLLTVKDAARTSVLSKTWRDKWRHITSLSFCDPHLLRKLDIGQCKYEIECPKYVRWVNHMIESYKAPNIDVLKVEFKLDKTNGSDIDYWIDFAFLKKVRRLEMDLAPVVPSNTIRVVRNVTTSSNYLLPKSLGFTACDSLIILRLKHVDVSGEILESLLSNCLFLEELCVVKSNCLVNLRVSGPSLRLKYLEIIDCLKIQNLEVYAQSLVSFKYVGPVINMPLKDVPQLSEILIGGRYCEFQIFRCCHLSNYFCQLEKLELGLQGVEVHGNLVQFPILPNLKHLELTVRAYDGDCFLCFCPLIEASPSLNKFVLELVLLKNFGERKRKKVKLTKKFSHQSLKVVELRGFVGHITDSEFAFYFILNADMLEKMVFDSRDPVKLKCPWEVVEETKERSEARKCAQRLKTKLPPDVDVIII